jgi:hypothetical protein
MTKFLYCMICKNRFQLERAIKRCTCGNVGGRYTNCVHAEVCAENPGSARFVGINKFRDDFEDLKNKFFEINNGNTWEEWQKGHLAQDWEEWETNLKIEGYSVATMEFIKELHERATYNESLCKEFQQ